MFQALQAYKNTNNAAWKVLFSKCVLPYVDDIISFVMFKMKQVKGWKKHPRFFVKDVHEVERLHCLLSN